MESSQSGDAVIRTSLGEAVTASDCAAKLEQLRHSQQQPGELVPKEAGLGPERPIEELRQLASQVGWSMQYPAPPQSLPTADISTLRS